MLGGQKRYDSSFDDKVILVGEEVGNKIRICGVNSLFDFATPIPVGGLGESSSRIIVDREFNGQTESVFTIVSVELSLMKMSPHCDVFSKKIVLKSKGIISNSTPYNLILKEEWVTRFHTDLPANTRLHSVFGMPEIKNKKANGYTVELQGYTLSPVFYLPEEGCIYFKLQGIKQTPTQDKLLYFNIKGQHVEGYIFYELKEVKEEELPYEIVTKTDAFKLEVGHPRNHVVKVGESCRFLRETPPQESFEISLIISHP